MGDLTYFITLFVPPRKLMRSKLTEAEDWQSQPVVEE